MKQGKMVELLAPAGTMEALKAVIDAGCDAVYLGGKIFSMRQHGNWLHFDNEQLAEAIAYGHRHRVRVYVTVNNLLTDAELTLAGDYLDVLRSLAPDALIVQDLGLIRLARARGITLPLHASTMMNVHNTCGAAALKDMGISRMILSRDIPAHEAARIGREAGVEVEIFVHNDICAAQGSLCYLSGMATTDSSNRGRCLKPCRWQWDLIDADDGRTLGDSARYLLAKKDLCLLHQLPELMALGIDSFKIEGRARKAPYLHRIVGAYRDAIDRYAAAPWSYRTDFAVFRRLHEHRVRDYTTNGATGAVSPTSVDDSGQREPRIFSIAIEEKDSSHRPPLPAARDRTPADARTAAPSLAVRCATPAGARQALCNGADRLYVAGEIYNHAADIAWTVDVLRELTQAAHDGGATLGLALPVILNRREQVDTCRLLSQAADLGIDEILVGSVAGLRLVRDEMGDAAPPITTDFTCNAFNTRTVEQLAELGAQRVTLSVELPLAEVTRLAATSVPLECIVHGSVTAMLVEWCILAANLGRLTKHDPCPGFCRQSRYALRDRLGRERLVAADQYCRNHLLAERDLCLLRELPAFAAAGVRSLRILGQHYEPGLLGRVTALYRKYLSRLGRASDATVTAADWAGLTDISPRPLGPGAYAHTPLDVAGACATLPTDEIIVQNPRNACNLASPGDV